METLPILIALLIIFFSWSIVHYFKPKLDTGQKLLDTLLFISWFISLALIIFGNQFVGNSEYYEQIDPVSDSYSPISRGHMITLVCFFVLYTFSAFGLWLKGKQLPPLTFVVCSIAVVWWMMICVPLFIQFNNHQSDDGSGPGLTSFYILIPVIHFIQGFSLFILLIRQKSKDATLDYYQNRFLNSLNNMMVRSNSYSLWIFILFVPFLIIVLCILQLLGQYPDSLIKVFTDTTTWTFSQKSHPPYLDHKGHYLCTVAACGSPKLVKPVKIGNRHGNPIIVNRQLQIANAFEDVIETRFPSTHKIIRHIYDKYGYPLSKNINSKRPSNITFVLMKPLEWVFLLFIYFTCSKPEELIKKQYQ